MSAVSLCQSLHETNISLLQLSLNIGSALIFYLPQDLNLEGHQLNTALAVFFPAYIVCNVPANMLIKKMRPCVFREGP